MKIGIDARTAYTKDGRITGIGTYTRSLLEHMIEFSDDHEFVVFVSGSGKRQLSDSELANRDNITLLSYSFLSIPFISNHVFAPIRAMLRGVDVWFSPNGQIPWGWKKSSVITVHDVSIYDHPEWFPEKESDKLSAKFVVPKSMEKADRIIAVSNFTKERLLANFPESKGKINVVHEGVEVPDFENIETHANDQNTILHIGTLEPRKNLVNAIEAFDRFLEMQEQRVEDTRFLLAGKFGWKFEEIQEIIESVNKKWKPKAGEDVVRHLGYISEQEKWSLLRQASVFLFPSREEGFGLPVLEAMAAGVPVVTTRNGAIPEIGGDSVFYVNAEDAEQMALTLAQCLLVPEGLEGMLDMARQKAEKFNWKNTARETLSVIESID